MAMPSIWGNKVFAGQVLWLASASLFFQVIFWVLFFSLPNNSWNYTISLWYFTFLLGLASVACNLGPWPAQILLNLEEGLGIHQRKVEKAVRVNEIALQERVGWRRKRAEDRTPRSSYFNANTVISRWSKDYLPSPDWQSETIQGIVGSGVRMAV